MPSVASIQNTERELAADMLCGGRRGFEQLYNRYAPTLFGCILKTVADKKVAEDILQTSFVKMWSNRQVYEAGRQSLFTWMLGITQRSVKEYVNSRQDTAGNGNLKPISIVNIEDIVNDKGLHSDPGKLQRAVLDMMYFNSCSLKKVAELLKTDEAKIRAILRSAINNLKNLSDE